MILVTGGAGYIGSHCVYELLKQNQEVIVFDNISTGHYKTIKVLSAQFPDLLHFYRGDLLTKDDLQIVFSLYKIDSVIHFAALSQVSTSMSYPYEYYNNNVVGTMNLLETMVNSGVRKIVFSSTASIYGNPVELPITESHPKQPINTYGCTKMIIEQMLADFDRAYGLKSISLRYFNVVGSNGIVGEWHEPETHLIPCILKSTSRKSKPFHLYGQDYNTKDGTCVRDYIDVTDLAQAHLLALQYLDKTNTSDCFNLGTNQGYTVKEILATCEEVTKKYVPVIYSERRPGDPPILIADNHKAMTLLGWEPTTSIEKSIQSAYEWEQSLQHFKN